MSSFVVKMWGSSLGAWVLGVWAVATMSQSGRNNVALMGLLSPGTEEVSGVVLPLTGGMKFSVFSFLVACCGAWFVTVVVWFVKEVTFRVQEPSVEKNVDDFRAFREGVPQHLLKQRGNVGGGGDEDEGVDGLEGESDFSGDEDE